MEIAQELFVKPLSINRAFQGRRFKTPEFKAFEQEVGLLLPWCKTPIKGNVEVSYVFSLRNVKLTDTDNLVKCFQDILVKKGYIEDDRMIYVFHAAKVPAKRDSIFFAIKRYSLPH